jgi:hypothetical protein
VGLATGQEDGKNTASRLASASAWIFVLRLPRERPIACFCSPLSPPSSTRRSSSNHKPYFAGTELAFACSAAGGRGNGRAALPCRQTSEASFDASVGRTLSGAHRAFMANCSSSASRSPNRPLPSTCGGGAPRRHRAGRPCRYRKCYPDSFRPNGQVGFRPDGPGSRLLHSVVGVVASLAGST